MENNQYLKGESILKINLNLETSELRSRVMNNLAEIESSIRTTDVNIWQKVKESLNSLDKPWPLQQHVLMEARHQNDIVLARYLCARYRYDFYPKQQILDEYPPCVQIEPTSICNFRCVFCFQTDIKLNKPNQGHMGQMTFEMFKSIVDEIEGKVDFITLASRGEPLLNKKLPEMLAYAKGKFLGLKINTNASHLTDEMSRIILDSGVSTVVFSADAGDKDVYESLRVNGNFEKVMSNISKFNQIRKLEFSNSKTLTRVSGVLFNPAKQDMASHREAWENLVDQVAFVNYLPWENPYDSKPSEVDEPCSDLWRRMFIWWDGKVNPCDVDYLSWLSVGNVKAHKVSELWNSEGYSSLRKSHNENMRKSITPCKSCFVK